MTAFFKMHAQGNHYIYFDLPKELEFAYDWQEKAIALSNRHFGIGGDGIVLIFPSEKANARMRMFNADGSEAEMCGSALRCIGYYVYEKFGLETVFIETKAGIKRLLIQPDSGIVSAEMGIPEFIKPEKIEVAGVSGYQVSVGNPHFVSFQEILKPEELNSLGKTVEHHSAFSNGTNVDFVNIVNRGELDVYFWERGSGNTLACGTGAIASFYTALQLGLVHSSVQINMPGGTIEASCKGNQYWLSGTVQNVFQGEIEL